MFRVSGRESLNCRLCVPSPDFAHQAANWLSGDFVRGAAQRNFVTKGLRGHSVKIKNKNAVQKEKPTAFHDGEVRVGGNDMLMRGKQKT